MPQFSSTRVALHIQLIIRVTDIKTLPNLHINHNFLFQFPLKNRAHLPFQTAHKMDKIKLTIFIFSYYICSYSVCSAHTGLSLSISSTLLSSSPFSKNHSTQQQHFLSALTTVSLPQSNHPNPQYTNPIFTLQSTFTPHNFLFFFLEF